MPSDIANSPVPPFVGGVCVHHSMHQAPLEWLEHVPLHHTTYSGPENLRMSCASLHSVMLATEHATT